MNKEVNVYSFNDECYVYFGDYKKLQKQNTELKDNWNKLKEWLEDELGSKYIHKYDVLDKLQEIEGGMNE